MYSCDGFAFIGNGFDLHLGLKTSLKDFFVKKVLKKTKAGLWIYSGENIIYLLIYFRYFSFHQNSDFGCFRKVDSDNPSWMDVEGFIKKIAKHPGIFNLLINAYKGYCDDKLVAMKEPKETNLVLYPLFDIFKKRKPKKSGSYSVIKKMLLDDLLRFEEDFKKYVCSEVKIKEDYDSKSYSFLQKIVQTALKKEKDCYINAYNFNYTKIGELKYASNVHGTIDDKIIIGYDSTNDNVVDEFIELSKDWQKISIDIDFDIREVEIDNVIFYGHSLGEQDYPYFFEVFDACDLLNPDSYTKISFCYSKFGSKDEQIQFFNTYQQDIAKLLNSYEKYRNNVNGRNTIVTKLKSQRRLELVEIID